MADKLQNHKDLSTATKAYIAQCEYDTVECLIRDKGFDEDKIRKFYHLMRLLAHNWEKNKQKFASDENFKHLENEMINESQLSES